MDLQQITQKLHHRAPYLMVSRVIEMTKTTLHTEKVHQGDEAHLRGHFPGKPVVPGAMLQEFCTQSAGVLIASHYSPVENYSSETTKGHALGVLHKVKNAKFLKPARPHLPLEAKIELIERLQNVFEFKAKVFQEGSLIAKLQFQLVNIKDSQL